MLINREMYNFSGCRPKIPIVLYTWLDECMDQKRLLPVGNHLIGETGSSNCQIEKITRTQTCNTEATKTGIEKKDGADPNISFESAKFPRATISYSNSQISKRIKITKSQSIMKSLMDQDLTLPEIAIKDSMPPTLKNPWARKNLQSSLSDNHEAISKRNFPIEDIKQTRSANGERNTDVHDIFQFQIFSGKSFTSSGFSKKQVRVDFTFNNQDEYHKKRSYQIWRRIF
jgi:hypothetical protein